MFDTAIPDTKKDTKSQLEQDSSTTEFEDYRTCLQIGEQIFTSSEILAQLKQYQILPQLLSEITIDREINKIDCTEEETTSAYQRFMTQHRLSDRQELITWASQKDLSTEELELMILRPFKIAKFKQSRWGDRVETYFHQNKKQLDLVMYSQIAVDTPDIAQELYFRLQEGEQSFAELAPQYSQGSEANTNGIVGPIRVYNLHATIARTLLTSRVGQLQRPMMIGKWYFILRLEKFISAELDNSMYHSILNDFFDRWLVQERQQLTVIAR